MLFKSTQDAWEALTSVGYETDEQTASTVYLADFLGKPILLEGQAGAGKTELAMAISKARNLQVERLQCYDGLTSQQVIGYMDQDLRSFYLQYRLSQGYVEGEWDKISEELNSPKFFREGPILRAFRKETQCLLLIDELDKVGKEVESMLLEAFSAYAVSTPEFGVIRARSRPFTIITSNAERKLEDPIRRRCLYIKIRFPSPQREAAIVAIKTPDLPQTVHTYIAALAETLRLEKFEKPPSVSEMQDVARVMHAEGISVLESRHLDLIMPLFCKTPNDVDYLMNRPGTWDVILRGAANRFALME